MKILTIFISLILISKSQNSELSDRLCLPKEEIVISFLTSTKKVVTVAKEKNGNYIVYRFGTKDKVELQYPSTLDVKSWQLFTYSGEWRFGGIQNAGFGDLKLSFTNIDTKYIIFQNWNDEDSSSDFGLSVSKNNLKAKNLMIDKKSKSGSLMRLNDCEHIKNIALEE